MNFIFFASYVEILTCRKPLPDWSAKHGVT
jgi:hypothetical protein